MKNIVTLKDIHKMIDKYKMTSVVVGGLFNAVDFAGAGFIFSKLNAQGYKEEVKRHNQALEKLAKAKEKFFESELKRRNDEARR
jgi:phosphoribosylformylglycinamidine (FGAM) synthase-like amidotransferase family enzyme